MNRTVLILLVLGSIFENVDQVAGESLDRSLVEERLLKMLWTKGFPDNEIEQRTRLVQLVTHSKDYSAMLDYLQRVNIARLNEVVELLGQLMLAVLE